MDQASGLIRELGLAALQMQLQGRFGHIDSGIDSNRYGLHSGDRVRTHPYVYELTVIADRSGNGSSLEAQGVRGSGWATD